MAPRELRRLLTSPRRPAAPDSPMQMRRARRLRHDAVLRWR